MSFFFVGIFVLLVFWRPQEWLAPQLYGLPLLDALVALGVFALLIDVNERRMKVPRGPVLWLFGGLFLATLMSHVAHTYFAGMVTTLAETWKYCLVTAVLYFVLDKPSRIRNLAAMFVAMACVMAVHALLQHYRGYGFVGQPPMFVPPIGDRPEHYRTVFFGIFDDPNDLAQILATSIPLAFCVPRRVTLFSVIWTVTVTVLLFVAIRTTHSRGGYIALATVLAVMLVLVLPPRWLPRASLLLVVSALVAMPFSTAYLDTSAHDRVVFWGWANEFFKQNPFFGIGYGMFWMVAEDRAAHNAFVQCYTELGFFGYWFWFCLLMVGLVGCWRVRIKVGIPQDAEEAYLRRCAGLAVAAMLGFCASAYFLSRAFVYPLFFLFALLAGITRVAQDRLPDGCRPLIDAHKDVMVLGTVAAFGSILYIYISILLLNKAFGGY